MNEIRKLTTKDSKAMARLLMNAYPGYDISEDALQKTQDFVRRQVKQGADDQMVGHFEPDGSLSGGIRLLMQPFNLRMKKMTAVGLGALSVSLLHKKEKIALNLICWTFEHARSNGACMAVLDPFNIGFYRKMGCGIGILLHRFQLKPLQFPGQGDKNLITELTENDNPDIMAYHQKYFRNHHGMMQRSDAEIEEILKGSQIVFGVRQKNSLSGLMACRFERTGPQNLFKTNMIVEELLVDDPEVLHAFLAIIHTQSDQVSEVILTSQERYFESLFRDPGNGNDDTFQTRKNEISRTACGMMYRILDVPKVLGTIAVNPEDEHIFPIRLVLEDTLLTAQSGEWFLKVSDGHVSATREAVPAKHDLHMDIGDLSSLVMGSVDLMSLDRYGKINHMKQDQLTSLNKLFYYHTAPVCLSRF